MGWNQLGHLLQRAGELDEAEAAYRQVKLLGEADNDDTLLAVAYGNLGILYQTRGDLEQAEAMYRKSLSLFQDIGATPQVKQVQGLLKELRDTKLGVLYQ